MDEWLRLFRSANPTVRHRAAEGLLRRGDAVPLPVLLEILDELHDHGLGAATEWVLRTRREPELPRRISIDQLARMQRAQRTGNLVINAPIQGTGNDSRLKC